MQKIADSQRIRDIEQKWQGNVKQLFYDWHWKENLRHKEIAEKIGIPRPTVTKWFKNLGIYSQARERFTNLNLLNVGLRRGPKAKPKIKKEGVLFANIDFFKKWTREMAYILGYFAADGSMYRNSRGAYFIDFVSTDKELIVNAKRMFGSRHTISESFLTCCPNHKKRYRLQIGSKEMFNDLLKLGLTPRKSKIIKLPAIPKQYFADFVRGNFDGDGCVKFGLHIKKGRRKSNPVFVTQFSSGSKDFLVSLLQKLQEYALIRGGSVYVKQDKKGESYVLLMSIKDSFRFSEFIYRDAEENVFLRRKYNIFQGAKEYYKKNLGA
ncbi:MAG: hypothetical protein NTV62_03240 [Candidatus Gribaldobacteria bacterium]|nr:hypothetical protein [Candidatus Gribaldobacteria bacterium]